MPYESRGLYVRKGWVEPRGLPERFSEATWIQRDLCDRTPFPFGDRQIDFAICSQTLEDLRDPVWVCSELQRVAKAGYIEVPSRLEEQSWGVNGPFVGWSHHRWLVDIDEARIEFVHKLHSIHSRPDQCFPSTFYEQLTVEERVQSLWWTGELVARERIFLEEEESDRYLSDFVSTVLAARGWTADADYARRGPGWERLTRRLASGLTKSRT